MKYFLFSVLLFPLLGHCQVMWKLQPIDFFKLSAEHNFGEAVGLAVNSHNHVFVFHRGPGSLMEFDSSGHFIRTMGEGFIKKAHGLRIDPQDNIWVTDVEHHLVIRYSPEGVLTLVLGKIDTPGEWNEKYGIVLFNRPADVAFDAMGNTYVADGYGNSRIVKFDPQGNFIKTWGVKGSKMGEFDLPHAIVIDSKKNVYVVDRENKRIQVFDTEGKFLNEWNNVGNPYGLAIDHDQLFITDGVSGTVSMLDQTGRIKAHYGKPGKAVGQFLMPHALAVSPDHKLFVAETINWRVQCFRIP